jgi:hypothetical protein
MPAFPANSWKAGLETINIQEEGNPGDLTSLTCSKAGNKSCLSSLRAIHNFWSNQRTQVENAWRSVAASP